MTSTIITPRRTRVSLSVPSWYIGKQVTVTFALVEEQNNPQPDIRLSDQFRSVFSPEDAKSFNKHTQTMRDEWTNI